MMINKAQLRCEPYVYTHIYIYLNIYIYSNAFKCVYIFFAVHINCANLQVLCSPFCWLVSFFLGLNKCHQSQEVVDPETGISSRSLGLDAGLAAGKPGQVIPPTRGPTPKRNQR